MKKQYIQPLAEIICGDYEEGVMDWVSTPVTDDEISDDDFNAKRGSFDRWDDGGFFLPANYNPWED